MIHPPFLSLLFPLSVAPPAPLTKLEGIRQRNWNNDIFRTGMGATFGANTKPGRCKDGQQEKGKARFQ